MQTDAIVMYKPRFISQHYAYILKVGNSVFWLRLK